MNNKIFLLMALAVACLSCSKDRNPGLSATEREVEMNFLLPGTATRAVEADEEINNLAILVFDKDGKYLYSRYAWKKEGTRYTTTMRIGKDFTVCFAANRSTVLQDLAHLTEGVSEWTDVRDALIMDTPKDMSMLSKGLPMWGMAEGVEVKEQAANNLGTFELVRSVASIDIFMLSPDFEFKEGYTVFAANKGYMAYDPDKMSDASGILRATEPYSPPGFLTDIDLKYTLKPGDNGEIADKFYIYENSTPLAGENGNRATKVVLMGVWTDPEDPAAVKKESYYPLTLRKKVGKEYVRQRVMRNNKYTIIVNNVHGDGYGDLGEAKDADDVNWDYDVIIWDDNKDGQIEIDGTKYFFRDRSSVTLPRNAGSATRVNIKTNYSLDSDVTMKFATGEEIDAHPRFLVELVKKEDVPGETSDFLRITAKQDYGASDNPAVLNVEAGRISFKIHIAQLDQSPHDWNNGGNIGVVVE